MTDEKFATRKELDEFRQEVRTWLGDMLSAIEMVKANPVSSEDLPPTPPKTSRKYQGEKGDIRARVDKTLFDLLVMEAEAQSGKNISRQLDIILWKHFGKPKLSWEVENNGKK